jgi:hypothetical protein
MLLQYLKLSKIKLHDQYSNIKEKPITKTCDGASVMSGHINGVQTLVRREYSFARIMLIVQLTV